MYWGFILIGLVTLAWGQEGDYNNRGDSSGEHSKETHSDYESKRRKAFSQFRWSGGKKPPPAYEENSNGVYDVEVQPGDEERIYHYESNKLRPLNDKVKRWHYKVQKGEEPACGFPICILLDGIPWRFKSLCDFKRHLDQSKDDHTRRFFHIQKGDCADAIEEIGWKKPWTKKGSCHACRENEFCNTKICWAHDNKAKTFENICELLSHLNTDVISGWIGIGDCRAFFSSDSCINTEWFDIDHPCGLGDVEHSRTNILYTEGFQKTGRSRMCPIEQIKGNMEVRTVEGGNLPSDQVIQQIDASSHSYEGEQIVCKNAKQTKKPGPPFFWPYKDVKCRDYKVRHCCKGLFGSSSSKGGYHKPSSSFSIKTPAVKTLFDECEWKPFVSNCYPKEHDQEDRGTLSRGGYRKHVCGTPIFNSMFIDARTRKDDVPFYETGEKLTKVSPTYGLLCSNVNNQYGKKNCSDYKVRFCCLKNAPASWGSWGAWSKCSKSCNGGFRKSKRTCKHNNHKHSCYGKKIKSFKERRETCYELPCPEDSVLSAWQAWSPCSTTCGLGERRRTRICEEGRYQGKNCPEDFRKYFEIQQCPKQLPCPIAMWAKWSSWSDCSSSCGYGVKRKTRTCIDMFTRRELGKRMNCLGGSHFIDEKCFDKKCTLDGGWTAWLSWEECNVLCGRHGTRVRRRYCANPIPSHGGKQCKGDKIEKSKCPHLDPCPIHCVWSIWGSWTKCSLSCGPVGSGSKERRRHIALEAKYGGMECDKKANLESEHCPHCEHKKSKHCIPYCPVNCEWSTWSFVGECLSCYHDEKRPRHLRKYPARKIRFVKKHPKHNGKECGAKGISEENKVTLDCSRIPKCPKSKGKAIWSQWSQWGICTGICGSEYFRKRTRECISTETHSKCHGKSSQEEKCKKTCSELGWTDWKGWSDCPVTCGKGKRTRKRECFIKKLEGKEPCKGRSVETNICDCGPCGGKGHPIQTEGENFVNYMDKKYKSADLGDESDKNKKESDERSSRDHHHKSSHKKESQESSDEIVAEGDDNLRQLVPVVFNDSQEEEESEEENSTLTSDNDDETVIENTLEQTNKSDSEP